MSTIPTHCCTINISSTQFELDQTNIPRIALLPTTLDSIRNQRSNFGENETDFNVLQNLRSKFNLKIKQRIQMVMENKYES